MNLIVDIGNTLIKATFFNNSKIEKKYSFEKSKTKKLYELLDASNIEKIFISNVGSQIDTLELSKYKKVLHFKQNLKIPLKLNYRDKNKLGKDRIAAMVGARKLFSEKNLLVIDIGTCITMDVLTNDGIFLGGRISPGIQLRYKSLSFTQQLPLLNFVYKKDIYGNDTESSIHTGIQRSIISEIRDFNSELLKQLNSLYVIVTGGDMNFLLSELKNTIFASEENLVAIGLYEIMNYNDE